MRFFDNGRKGEDVFKSVAIQRGSHVWFKRKRSRDDKYVALCVYSDAAANGYGFHVESNSYDQSSEVEWDEFVKKSQKVDYQEVIYYYPGDSLTIRF